MRYLYKRDSTGKMRVWAMEQDGRRHRTIAGVLGGNLTTSADTTCVGKQGRTDEEQAAFEVNSGYAYQLAREYFETPEEADGPARFFKPMLAQKYGDLDWQGCLDKVTKLRQSTKALVGTGVFSQPKLDGFCCIAQKSGLTSREGQPIVSVPHIERILASFFFQYPDAVLHGELYNHDLHDDFQELSSILKQQKPTEAELHKSAALAQFHVYDYPGRDTKDLPFSERFSILREDLGSVVPLDGCIRLVETTAVEDEGHLNSLHQDCLDEEYEGQIVRLDLPYEQKRSYSVLKRKIFDDNEFDVVAIEEGKGNWAGVAKSAKFWMPGADRSEGPNDDNTFGAGIKGSKAFTKKLLTEDHKVATVRHFGLTKSGKPRMGVVTHWHGAERTL